MNINEIAKMAEVSRAAVSRYLNNGYVSDEKKERIAKVIKETGYRPSSQAQMLRTKKTKMIGVIIPKINSQSISRMVAGISDMIEQYSYQLLLANTNNNPEEELKYLKVFKENHVDGIIFIATQITEKHKKVLNDFEIPVVILGQKIAGLSCVYQDDYHAAKEITKVLLQNSSNPGMIGVLEKDQAVGFNRKKGFLDALIEQDRVIHEHDIAEADFSTSSGYEKMKQLYEANPKIDAVLCVTESIAIGAMSYMNEIGKRIPQDIRIAGMGDSSISGYFQPKLTTVHFHYKTSGMEAAKILLEEIKNQEAVKKDLCMSYQIMIGGSTE